MVLGCWVLFSFWQYVVQPVCTAGPAFGKDRRRKMPCELSLGSWEPSAPVLSAAPSRPGWKLSSEGDGGTKLQGSCCDSAVTGVLAMHQIIQILGIFQAGG